MLAPGLSDLALGRWQGARKASAAGPGGFAFRSSGDLWLTIC